MWITYTSGHQCDGDQFSESKFGIGTSMKVSFQTAWKELLLNYSVFFPAPRTSVILLNLNFCHRGESGTW